MSGPEPQIQSEPVADQAVIALPDAVRSFFDASNRGDADGVLACFAPVATLSDGGRTFRGRDGVASWDRTDNTGVQSKLLVLSATSAGDRASAKVRVQGNGFNGVGEMHFTLAEGRIVDLRIE